ncbi:hypothetical protein [Novispirillum itersonii]|uniref:Uncharacterized protein n=1 Tax=Novispirillum itersonii TaxID=189 RepID=A0A7W9ZGI8_NOVIT|nr:hypothetical protein [Novispirillum itersonii]MBB6210643.1 hypothetical protein [Novispirillum itersonii]
MAQATNSRRSAKWGQAKVSVSVLGPEIRKLRDQGLSWREVYARLEVSGKADGFSLPSFYRWVRDNTPEGQKKQKAKGAVPALPAPVLLNAPAPLPPSVTIQPATPVTGTENGSVLMLGEDDGTG